MPPTRIVIVLYGGLVQDVFCSDAGAEVSVVDWDTAGCEATEPGLVEVTDRFGRPQLAHVSQPEAYPLQDLAGTDMQAAIDKSETSSDSL